ncbi:MAG: holo-ACP synthase [Alphaproteobacteria bacterium]|nr:holo-ACP synthase [Alphaproteobacteria bacterium]
MIFGIGCDIVQVARFNRGGSFIQRFIAKHMTAAEQEEFQSLLKGKNEQSIILSVAARFAGKEAVAKALGSGFQGGITLKDIEITHDELGCPHVRLYKKALLRAYQVSHEQQFKIHITLSNEKEYANAVAVFESV